jgi:hypothetical protein
MLKKYVGKKVTIFLKSGFRNSGVLVEVGNDFCKINDRYIGHRLISFDAIESIEDFNNKKKFERGKTKWN